MKEEIYSIIRIIEDAQSEIVSITHDEEDI